MTTAINSAIFPFANPTTEPKAGAIRFIDEKLASVSASDISEDFRKLSRFLPVLVLVPKSTVADQATQKTLEPNKSVTDPEDFRKLSRFLPVLVLVPKSAVDDQATQKTLETNKSVTDPEDFRKLSHFL